MGSWSGEECEQQASEVNGNSSLKKHGGASRDATVKEQGLRLSETGDGALEKLQQSRPAFHRPTWDKYGCPSLAPEAEVEIFLTRGDPITKKIVCQQFEGRPVVSAVVGNWDQNDVELK